MKLPSLFILLFSLSGCLAQDEQAFVPSPPELIRIQYTSSLDNLERDYFLYLPKGYHNDTTKQWPVVLHLHGNGERGNGKSDLKWLTKHGPLMEAWIQKRDFPFILIVPQLHMLGMDTLKSYIANRDSTTIPQRLKTGVPERLPIGSVFNFNEPEPSPLPYPKEGNIRGWNVVEEDLLEMVKNVQTHFRGNKNKTYLTGLSYGGFGTWYLSSMHPNTFAAIAPVCGWGHPDLMPSIAQQELPVWCFAGEKDAIIESQHFKPGFKKLAELNYTDYRFTIVPNVGHDVWKPVYQGDELYEWLLKHTLDD